MPTKTTWPKTVPNEINAAPLKYLLEVNPFKTCNELRNEPESCLLKSIYEGSDQ
ncbi:hypothetical protein D3C80_1489970 [compost metagenome]